MVAKKLLQTSYFSPLGWQGISLRLGVALLAGAVIGLERETKRKPAGLRTNMLVSFGCALLVLVPIERCPRQSYYWYS